MTHAPAYEKGSLRIYEFGDDIVEVRAVNVEYRVLTTDAAWEDAADEVLAVGRVMVNGLIEANGFEGFNGYTYDSSEPPFEITDVRGLDMLTAVRWITVSRQAWPMAPEGPAH